MPIYDIYRVTTTRERYTVECESPEQALQWLREGHLSLDEDEVINCDPPQVCLDGVMVLDGATE